MQKHYLILLLFSLSLFAQKKEYILDENSNILSKNEFATRMKAPSKYVYTTIENDTATIIQLGFREQKGKLQPGQRERIVQSLKVISGRYVEPEKTIIINFFYPDIQNPERPIIDRYVKDPAYKREAKRSKDIEQFYVTSGGFIYGAQENVYQDTTGLIQELFQLGDSSNYIIIKPDGRYLLRLGEHRRDEIIENAGKNF